MADSTSLLLLSEVTRQRGAPTHHTSALEVRLITTPVARWSGREPRTVTSLARGPIDVTFSRPETQLAAV